MDVKRVQEFLAVITNLCDTQSVFTANQCIPTQARNTVTPSY